MVTARLTQYEEPAGSIEHVHPDGEIDSELQYFYEMFLRIAYLLPLT